LSTAMKDRYLQERITGHLYQGTRSHTRAGPKNNILALPVPLFCFQWQP